MSKDLDVNKLMDNVKALTIENENLLRKNEESISLRSKSWRLILEDMRKAMMRSIRLNVR